MTNSRVFVSVLVAICALSSLGGCSFFAIEEDFSPQPRLLAISVYLARGSIVSTEFEQYKVHGLRLYAECGQITHGRNSPAEKFLWTLNQDQFALLANFASAAERAKDSDSSPLSPAGEGKGFADPGKATITVEREESTSELKTSVDELASQTSAVSAAAAKLVRRLRALSMEKNNQEPLCRNRTFFGIGLK